MRVALINSSDIVTDIVMLDDLTQTPAGFIGIETYTGNIGDTHTNNTFVPPITVAPIQEPMPIIQNAPGAAPTKVA